MKAEAKSAQYASNDMPEDASRNAHDSYFLVALMNRRGDRPWPEALCFVASRPVPAITIENTDATSGDHGHDD